MKRAKSGGLGRVLDDILDVLARHGEVTISAHVSGRVFEVRVQDGATAARTAPARSARSARSAVAATGASSADAVYASIAAIPVGLTLEDLAKQLGVRPRNALKPVLAELARAGKIKKVGRKFRSTSAVVRRGRRPGGGKAAAPKRGRKPAVAKRAQRATRPRPKSDSNGPAKLAAAAPAAKPAKPARPARRPGRKPAAKAAKKRAAKPARKPAAKSTSKSAKKSNGAKPKVVKNKRASQRRARMLDGAETPKGEATLAPAEKTPGVPSGEMAG